MKGFWRKIKNAGRSRLINIEFNDAFWRDSMKPIITKLNGLFLQLHRYACIMNDGHGATANVSKHSTSVKDTY